MFLSALLELRDRAQLTKKVTGDKKEKEDLANFRKFVEIVSKINHIYDALKGLYISGYPELIEIKIKISNYESEFTGCGLKTKDYRELESDLLKKLEELQNAQFKAYQKKPLIRFIYGRQFNLIYDLIKGKDVEKNKKKIIPFLMFLAKIQ